MSQSQNCTTRINKYYLIEKYSFCVNVRASLPPSLIPLSYRALPTQIAGKKMKHNVIRVNAI